jgi:putative intracellular protease/amidase
LPEIALFLYDDMTALDAVGPYEVLARLPDADVKFVASMPGPKKTPACGLWPASTSETRRQRDSNENLIRRGGCVPLAIPGLLSELGYRQPPASSEARTQSAVSQVCRQQS